MKTTLTHNENGFIIIRHPEKNEIANLTLKRLNRYGFVEKIGKDTFQIGLSFVEIFDALEFCAEDICGTIINAVENIPEG